VPGPTLGYITVAYIFDWGTLHFSTALGMLNWTSHVVNAIAGAAVLAWVVSGTWSHLGVQQSHFQSHLQSHLQQILQQMVRTICMTPLKEPKRGPWSRMNIK